MVRLWLTSPPAGANLMGSDLYNNLIRYFVGHLTELRNVCLDLGLARHTCLFG